MSNIEHPAIDSTLQYDGDVSVCRDFAEEAVEMLAIYGRAVSRIEDGHEVTRRVTDRIDVTGHPDDKIATALRLKRASCVPAEGEGAAPYPSGGNTVTFELTEKETYTVLNFELGKVSCAALEAEDVYEIRDEAYSWESYVLIVIDTKTYDAEILSGMTGEELSFEDTLQAMSALQFMHRALRFIRYEEVVGEDDEPIATTAQPIACGATTYENSFSTDEALVSNYDAHQCGVNCTASHQQTMCN